METSINQSINHLVTVITALVDQAYRHHELCPAGSLLAFL